MKSLWKKLTQAALILTTLPMASQAHPVSYQGSWGIMSWNTPDSSEVFVNHSVEFWFAPALSLYRYRLPLGDLDQVVPKAGFLLKRWNFPDSQANIYASLGYGWQLHRDRSSDAGVFDLDLDWENRRLYTKGKLELNRFGESAAWNFYRLRAGFAPYLAEFDELNTWLILQWDRNEIFGKSPVLTPFLRFFYKNVLWEVGISDQGDAAFNFMLHL